MTFYDALLDMHRDGHADRGKGQKACQCSPNSMFDRKYFHPVQISRRETLRP
jgi:hypothetical protein